MVAAKRISSSTNNTVKEAARLKRKRHRYERRLFLTEGEDLLEAALGRGIIPRQVFVVEEEEEKIGQRLREIAAPGPGRPRREFDIFACSPAVMEKLSELGSGSRVVCVFSMLDLKFPGGLESRSEVTGPVLYLAGAGDPGNVGTLVRSASALGAQAVILGPGAADPYSSKSLRATMGAIFQIPFFLTVSADSLNSWAQRAEVDIVCADAHAGVPVWEASLGGAFVLVLGSEREGVPRRLTDAAAARVRIPQTQGTESINVAMAGTAMLYEALRQRAKAQSPGRT